MERKTYIMIERDFLRRVFKYIASQRTIDGEPISNMQLEIIEKLKKDLSRRS